MVNWKEPHWSEGMLLLPQHLQNAQRYWEGLLGAAWQTSAPFSWGFGELVLSDAQIRDGVLVVERCRLRTPEGTWIVVPDNTEIAPRPFLDQLERSPEGMLAALAVPRLHEIRPNATYDAGTDGQPTRYLIEPLDRKDENSGDNPQQIEVHSLRGRLLLGEEINTPGYEAVPMVRLYLSGEEGGAPRRDELFIPPLIWVSASEDLCRMIREVLHEIGARSKELAAEAEKREMSFRSGVEEHVERLMMLHVLNESLAWLRQFSTIRELRPYVLYAELCRLAGMLSVFSSERLVMEYPVYDHSRIGENFRLVCDHIRALLRPFGPGLVKWRDFQPRETGDGLEVTLEEEWLSESCELYVGIHCKTMDDTELDQLLKSMDWKIASSQDVDQRFTGGLNGLELRPVRTATGILPSSPEIKYYQVFRDAELWPKVRETRTLAIRYSPAGQARLEGMLFRIYVMMSR